MKQLIYFRDFTVKLDYIIMDHSYHVKIWVI
jgi:hypothetical protein